MMSSSSAWFSDLAGKIAGGVETEYRAAYEAQLGTVQSQLSLLPEPQALLARNRFISGIMARTSSAATQGLEGATVAEVQNRVNAISTRLLGPVEGLLGELIAKAEPLRQAARAAWQVSATGTTTARLLLKAERVAAVAAAATGLPPVTAAWALATNARMLAVFVSEQAAIVARAADAAWAAVVKLIDTLRARVYAAASDIADMASDAVRSLTAGVNKSVPSAWRDLYDDLSWAVSGAP
jgi:hypothetical protein